MINRPTQDVDLFTDHEAGVAAAAGAVEAALREAGLQIIGFARRLDPGLEDRDFADAGHRLDQWGDRVFAAFGLNPTDIAALRERFTSWPRN